jgi:hypothetical protein
VTIQLEGEDGAVRVDLSQDGILSEEARQEARRNWLTMLEGLKRTVEQG